MLGEKRNWPDLTDFDFDFRTPWRRHSSSFFYLLKEAECCAPVSDNFCLIQSASPASLASLEARSPSAEMLRDCGMWLELDTLTRPISFFIGVCKKYKTVKQWPSDIRYDFIVQVRVISQLF